MKYKKQQPNSLYSLSLKKAFVLNFTNPQLEIANRDKRNNQKKFQITRHIFKV